MVGVVLSDGVTACLYLVVAQKCESCIELFTTLEGFEWEIRNGDVITISDDHYDRREWILKCHFKDYDKNLDEKNSVNC